MLFDRASKSFGRGGKGPDAFVYPHPVPTNNPDFLNYAFETTTQKLYTIDTAGQMQPFPFELSPSKANMFSDKQLAKIISVWQERAHRYRQALNS